MTFVKELRRANSALVDAFEKSKKRQQAEKKRMKTELVSYMNRIQRDPGQLLDVSGSGDSFGVSTVHCILFSLKLIVASQSLILHVLQAGNFREVLFSFVMESPKWKINPRKCIHLAVDSRLHVACSTKIIPRKYAFILITKNENFRCT